MSPSTFRRVLGVAGLWLLALATTNLCVLMAREYGLGWDSHAYWLAWHGPMYTTGPATPLAYLYSPAFAQLVWPLAQLPWPVFCAVTMALPAVAITWLLRPVRWFWAAPLWVIGLSEVLSGNIFWALALVALRGLDRPWLWVLPALTKVTPCLGPVWFAARGQWRALRACLGSLALVVAVSYAISPAAWADWVRFLLDHVHETSQPLGSQLSLPLVVRLPLALVLVGFAARTDRRWLLPVAMAVATPVTGIACWVVLAAIPRLRQEAAARTQSPGARGAQVADGAQVAGVAGTGESDGTPRSMSGSR